MAALASLLLVSSWGVLAVMRLDQARGALLSGRAHLLLTREELSSGNVPAARRAAAIADERFDRAFHALTRSSTRPLALLPVGRDNMTAVRTAAGAATAITEHLISVLAVVDELPGGLDALAPSGGRMRLEALEGLREPVESLAAELAFQLEAIRHAMNRPLLPVVEEALAEMLRETMEAERGARSAVAAVQALPQLLGHDGPRTYLFGAGNPAELRGVGGFLGAYAILTVEGGRFTFGPFRSISELPNLDVSQVQPPNPDFAQRFDRYGGAGFWLNINMTADFPSAAQAMIALYERTEGVRLDGVITADPLALRAVAETTGPVDIPVIGRVEPRDLVSVLANEAFGEFDDSATRKRVLGAVAASVFQRFLAGGDSKKSIEALLQAVSKGNLLVHSTDENVQKALEAAGMNGGLFQGDADYLNVAGVNGGANKVDFYIDRAVTYEATLEPEGRVRGRATVSLANHAPTSGHPRFVIGPSFSDFAAGEAATLLNVYCGTCEVSHLHREGTRVPIEAEEELGRPVFWTYERLRSGESVELAYDWLVARGWKSAGYLARYELVADSQVTLRPTSFTLRVMIPPGMTVVATSHHMNMRGEVLTWSGTLHGREHFTVTMRPDGDPVRHSLSRWLREPLADH